ncbi:hypothetical protein GGR60_001742 [Xanthomonas arboricola]|uniref:hypothetical protein n=1 Tax=Xanthomonas euroxanthea TaxID=2259622 RepID=UPI00141B86BC|nr:hypothetical protein [Xanthomonas euroxanthea]MBB3813142.1 hypothetical protein [Xanthomonas euroxanthea]NIK08981.1 hypothetical protein [Xanthomonas euroxanthea]NJC37207.1 hypothetical protein [Xanthomonas euroxanthea]
MESIRQRVATWAASLPAEVDAGSLYERCPVAHKWKATFRTVLVREASLWRMADLGAAFVDLVDSGKYLSARIILRSACETSALLAYLNKKLHDVVSGQIDFDAFNELTNQLLLGGKNNDYFPPVNVLTALTHFAKDHPLILDIYNRLSEDAHPNAAGMIYGFSTSQPEIFLTSFSNRFSVLDPLKNHTVTSADLVFVCYEQQYNEIWPQRFETFEQWLRDNDQRLDALRNGA